MQPGAIGYRRFVFAYSQWAWVRQRKRYSRGIHMDPILHVIVQS
jgi:hypothetical protein